MYVDCRMIQKIIEIEHTNLKVVTEENENNGMFEGLHYRCGVCYMVYYGIGMK